MVKDYLATSEDLQAIKEALRFVWHPKMRFVFKDRRKIKDAIVLTYDSKFHYIWTSKIVKNLTQIKSKSFESHKYHIYKIPHKIKIKDEWQYAWCTGVWHETIENSLPEQIKNVSRFKMPVISGGLLGIFLSLQDERNKTLNWPYKTRESYLATIIHEFAHVYWNQHKLWWLSDKKRNTEFLKSALKLYENKEIDSLDIQIFLPTQSWFGEVFAYCVEYWSSSIFWLNHKKLLDEFAKDRLEKLIVEENKKDLMQQDSSIEPTKSPHDFSFVLGKIILSTYPKTWPGFLINPPKLN